MEGHQGQSLGGAANEENKVRISPVCYFVDQILIHIVHISGLSHLFENCKKF